MDPWYLDHLVCPRDRGTLRQQDDRLICEAGHVYPVVDGIPVMLLDEVPQTMEIGEASLASASVGPAKGDPLSHLYIETLGISADEKRGVRDLASSGIAHIDPVVAFLVAATSGLSYKHLVGRLSTYPIPHLRLPSSRGSPLLDIGCNWGRWSIAAARKGYQVVGIDPSLGAILAAARVSRALGLPTRHVVGDARYLPFKDESFDLVFSYSVLQHLARKDVEVVLREVHRILASRGASLIQMPTALGLRCLYHQARRGFRDGEGFEVRYWSIPRLQAIFSQTVGSTRISVDCFFGIGLQESDLALMKPPVRFAVRASAMLRAASRVAPFMKYVADSVYVESLKTPSGIPQENVRDPH